MFFLSLKSRLDDVQARLKETNNEFESTRKKARKAKMEFENVKKLRYILLLLHYLVFILS